MYQPTYAAARSRAPRVRASCAQGQSVRSPFWIIRDEPTWESFSERDMPAFVESSLAVFTQHLKDYLASSGPSDAQKEQQLQIMLESLLHARYARALAEGVNGAP